ncbi:MAG: S-layer homology domain-containing protein [Candidatus Peregrinibacteria bacterium]
MPQAAFAVTSSSSSYKMDGQVTPIVGSPSSASYRIDSSGQPVGGSGTSASYKIEQGAIFPHETAAAASSVGSGIILGGGGGGGGGASTSQAPSGVEILDLEFSDTSPDSVRIVFTTDNPAVAHLEYGTDSTFESVLEEAFKFDHEIMLKNLTPGTTYKFIIRLKDMYQNITEFGEYSFTTPERGWEYFQDVLDEDWFAIYVNSLAEGGCVDTGADYFHPADNLTRSQAVKLLVCVEGFDIDVPEIPTFSDVPFGHWSYKYVETAYLNKVVEGYSGEMVGRFGPEDSITREQFAKMVVGVSDISPLKRCDMFKDSGLISQWACEYVGTVYAWSIVDGYPDGTFGPARNINRAEGAKMIANIANPVLRNGIDLSEEVPEEEIPTEEAPAEIPAEEGVVEVEIDLGPNGDLDFGLTDESSDEDLSTVMEYLYKALQEYFNGQ